MVSHRVYRSRPADQIEESNTTANRFLGGVRRNWMMSTQNPPVASGLPVHDGRTRKGPRPHTNPPSTAPTAAPTEAIRSGPVVTLLSPVTPGSTLPLAAPLQMPQVTVANKPSDPPPAALPSPVASPDSNPSPIASHDVPPSTFDTTASASDSPAVVAQPVDSYTATPSQPSNPLENGQEQRQNTPAATAALSSEPVLSSEAQRATPVQAPLHVATDRGQVPSPTARQSPYQSPSGASIQVNNPTDERQPPPEVPSPRAQQSGLILPNIDTWKQWKVRLEQLKAEARTFPPSPITWPRWALLDEALEKSDLLYLVLHQVYCRRSVDDKILSEFPALQDETCSMGLDKLSGLLEDNSRIPKQIVWSFANFPSNVENLRHEAWFSQRIQQVSQLSYGVATHLFSKRARIIEDISCRGYPPLASEMRDVFKVGSPVLLGVIFRSICRHLYSTDGLLKVERLFQMDLTISALFLEAVNQNMPQQQLTLKQQMESLMDEYKKIPMGQFSPASSNTQNQAIPAHLGPPSAGSQPSGDSPLVSTSAYPTTNLNSPQVTMVQVPGYFQHPYPYAHPSQQQQPLQHHLYQLQMQQQQIQSPQLQFPQQWQATQMGSFHPGLPLQGQLSFSSPMQPAPQRQPQPACAGQTPQSAQREQAQYTSPAQSRPSFSHASPAGVPSQHPPAHWSAQMARQQDPRLSNPSPVNTPVQRRASQISSAQSPQGRLGQQTTAPPPQVPSPVAQRPYIPYPHPSGPLLPPPNYRAPITVGPNPMRLGIHQADLRDPVKKLVKSGPQGHMVEAELYHFQSDFLLTPQSIDPNVHSYAWDFTLSEDDWHRYPLFQEPGQGQRSVRIFQPGCRTFRLRSIALSDSEGRDSERLWPTRGTTWPSVFYIHVNGVEMFVRRKVHNGKDLPLDITKNLRLGANKLVVHFLLDAKECENFRYFFGIERMVTSAFEHAQGTVGNMSADETRRLIHDRLTPSVNDDDVAFITDSLTISLTDPFTSQILKVPVRSRSCSHLECFDLETFIRTRKSESGPTPFFDNWRCPICDADARPQCLRVDNFLVEILDELAPTQGLETAKAIQVKADGSWTLKVAHDGSSVSPHPNRAGSVAAKRKADGITGAGPEGSRPKTECSSDRRPNGHSQERVVIEID